jgi:hypothetical protein
MALNNDEIQDIINRSGLDEEFIVNQQRAYSGRVVGGKNGGIELGKSINTFLNFAKVYITPGEELALNDDEIQEIIKRSGLDEGFIVTQQRAYNGCVVGGKNGCKSEDDWRLLLEKCKKHYEVHGIWPGQYDGDLGMKLAGLIQTAAGTNRKPTKPQPQLQELLKEYRVETKMGRRFDPSKRVFTADDDDIIWKESEKNRGLPQGTRIMPGKSNNEIALILSKKHVREITKNDALNRVQFLRKVSDI